MNQNPNMPNRMHESSEFAQRADTHGQRARSEVREAVSPAPGTHVAPPDIPNPSQLQGDTKRDTPEPEMAKSLDLRKTEALESIAGSLQKILLFTEEEAERKTRAVQRKKNVRRNNPPHMKHSEHAPNHPRRQNTEEFHISSADDWDVDDDEDDSEFWFIGEMFSASMIEEIQQDHPGTTVRQATTGSALDDATVDDKRLTLWINPASLCVEKAEWR